MTALKLSKSAHQTIFIILLFIIPFLTPATALLLGLILALTIGNPFIEHNKIFTKILLQVSVVGLGFGMNLATALQAGKTSIVFTFISITCTMTLGLLLGKWFKVERNIGTLVSGGTAICGGSAIAALGPVIRAKEQEMTVALGTVFILNAIALFIFPVIGTGLGMNDTQFGYWCAIAIHDTSSVVGAAATRGEEALKIATTAKLVRALWIIPLSLVIAYFYNKSNGDKKSKVQIPWFIFLYLLAMIIATYLPQGEAFYTKAVSIAHVGMIYTLFLIGSGLSRDSLKSVGFRPIILGVCLWIIIATASAAIIINL